ncbi:hypothetical protein B0H14DRAFT_3524570 [Mycena olivaceomarginata]|nr:hypothetical protein B0H14DRAFT_3524570 [Mycena olivaceomarginata]
MRRTQGELEPVTLGRYRRSDHPALFPPSISRTLSLQPSALSGAEHALADLSSRRHSLRLVIAASFTRSVILCNAAARCTRDAVSPERERARLPPSHSSPHASSSASFTASCSTRSHCRACPPTLRLALRAPPRRAPGPLITHPLRRAYISRTSVPAAAAASTLALATPMPTIVEPLPHGEAAPLPRRRTSTSSAPPAVASSSSSDGYRVSWTQERERTSSDSPARSSNGVGRKEPERTHIQDRGSDGAPTPEKGVRRRPSSPARYAATLAGAGGAIEGEEARVGERRGGVVGVGENGVLSRAASDLDPASSRPWASRRAAVVCAARRWDVPAWALLAAAAFLGPPQAHTRTSLSARDPASALASASAPPYKTHDASSSACTHPCLPADACVVRSWHAMHDERWTCVPRHHPRTSAPATAVSYRMLGPRWACLPGFFSPPARCAHPASAAAYLDAGRHTSTRALALHRTRCGIPLRRLPLTYRTNPVCICVRRVAPGVHMQCLRACLASLLLGCAQATHDAH